MHEMHVVKDLFADLIKLTKEHNAKKVTRIYLKMGDFTEINEEVLNFYFQEHSRDTVLAGAEIKIEKSPLRELRLISFDCD